MKLGYARVSTQDQDLSIQIKALINAGVDERNIFKEKCSSINPHRPQLMELLKYIKKNDSFIIYKLDRLGRSLVHLINIIDKLIKKDINFISLTESIDMNNAAGKLQFHMLAALAQYNRELIRERTIEGLAAAKSKGKILGRECSLNDLQKKQIDEMLSKNHSKYDIAKMLGLRSRSPIYTYLNSKEKA